MQDDEMSVLRFRQRPPHPHTGEPPNKAPSKPPTNPSPTPQVVTPAPSTTPDTPSPVLPKVPKTSERPVSTPAPTTNVFGVVLPVAKFDGDEFVNPNSYQS